VRRGLFPNNKVWDSVALIVKSEENQTF
jgi:hypothetical protein